MSKTNWDPSQYEKFKSQRSKPFFDLKDLIQKRPMNSVIDLGCGTGEQASILFDELRPTELIGIDSSSEMLSKSKEFEKSSLFFKLEDISTYKPDRQFDLVFSNAALQWLPNHEELIPKILSWVSPDGQIAIQMPFNHDHPSHTIAAKVAYDLFPSKFKKVKERSTLTLERYAEILFNNGFKSQVGRIEIYGHPMESGYDVIEWTKRTLLTGYQSKLTDEEFSEFFKAYTSTLIEQFGDGPYFYAFKRALIWGTKNA